MSAIKKFFEKKKLDAKFKQAGAGHKLTDDTSSRGSQHPKGAPTHPQRAAQDVSAENRMAAQAAVARLSQAKPGTGHAGNDTQSLRSQIRQEMEEERRNADMALRYKYSPKQVELESSPIVSGVFFHCPLVGEEMLPKAEMEARIESFLMEQMTEEPEMTAALLVHTLNQNATQVGQCVEVLCKYLKNIADHPTEEKYRKIRCSNKIFTEKVRPLRGTEDFLIAAGFEKISIPDESGGREEDYWVFDATRASDTERLKNLADVLVAAEPIRPQLARCTRAFRCSSTRGATLSDTSMTVPDEFYNVTAEELKREQRARTEAVEQLGMLRTKEMRERDRLRELRKYRYSLIRVRFPDDTVVQATFRASEKLAAVRGWLTEDCLAYDWIPYSLTASAGLKLEAEDKTLAELDLAPAAVVNFAYDAEVVRDLAAKAAKNSERPFDGKVFLRKELLDSAGEL